MKTKKLARWKKSYFYLGGRITIIKAALSNVPVYYMSLFRMAEKILFKMEKLQRDLFWGGANEGKYSSFLLLCFSKLALLVFGFSLAYVQAF